MFINQAAESVNSVFGPDTVTANNAQFMLRRFRSGNIDVKDARRTRTRIVENVDKIIYNVESDCYLSPFSIAQELKSAQKTVWNYLKEPKY